VEPSDRPAPGKSGIRKPRGIVLVIMSIFAKGGVDHRCEGRKQLDKWIVRMLRQEVHHPSLAEVEPLKEIRLVRGEPEVAKRPVG
jgi:hypothetical protein